MRLPASRTAGATRRGPQVQGHRGGGDDVARHARGQEADTRRAATTREREHEDQEQDLKRLRDHVVASAARAHSRHRTE